MNSYNLRLKPFDVIVIAIAVMTIATLVVKGIAYNSVDCFGYAIITGIALVLYVKRADMFS